MDNKFEEFKLLKELNVKLQVDIADIRMKFDLCESDRNQFELERDELLARIRHEEELFKQLDEEKDAAITELEQKLFNEIGKNREYEKMNGEDGVIEIKKTLSQLFQMMHREGAADVEFSDSMKLFLSSLYKQAALED